MKNFLHKVVVFFSIILFFLLGSVFLVKYCGSLKINGDQEIIVVGHSHPECAFNDSIITGLSNFSASGESYFYTYYKTKKLVVQNPQLQVIFIECSNAQICKLMDDWIWDEMYLSHFFPVYALFLDNEGYNLLYQKNSRGIKKNIVPVLKYNFKVIAGGLKYTNRIGGYLELYNLKSDSLWNKNKDELSSKILNEISEINMEYLVRLIKFCKKSGVKVFLIRSPVHKEYPGYKNEPLFREILSSRFSGIEFLDFSKFPLNDSEFADLEHLNFKGAKIFSTWIDELLNDSLLERDDKQVFINEEMNKYKFIPIDEYDVMTSNERF
ncbi:MAG: hypothetical protein JXL97_03870 [Bacteroidales bacterium]|nr:hypothetical protein [Prolixibacteraceae bacterium]MBN2890982.1 hypothetical protein [Bacteroidales bacterium]